MKRLICGAALAAMASSAHGAVLQATPASFAAVLAQARGGDVIQLAAGTYAKPMFVNRSFAPALHVVSKDPTHPAVFQGLGISNVTGLNLDQVEITAVGVADPYYAFRVSGATGLRISRSNIHGDPSVPPGLQAQRNGGFYIVGSTNVMLQADDIHDMNALVSVTRTNGFQVAGCTLRRFNKGAIEFSATTHLSIAGNTFSLAMLTPGTHSDLVQGFTFGTAAPSHDIVITGNRYQRTAAEAVPPMGFLIQDDAPAANLPYQNVDIEGNTLLGTEWNAIVLKHAVGKVTIAANTVASWTGLDPLTDGQVDPYLGRIGLMGDMSGAQISLTGNSAQAYIGPPNGKSMAVPAGNSVLGAVRDGGVALMALKAANALN